MLNQVLDEAEEKREPVAIHLFNTYSWQHNITTTQFVLGVSKWQTLFYEKYLKIHKKLMQGSLDQIG